MSGKGNCPDAVLFKRKLEEGSRVRFHSGENWKQRHLKVMMNNVLIEDVITNSYYPGIGKLEHHSAWKHDERLFIKMNQFRQHYWYFEPLVD